ncbi:hypothetical protein HanXRQr2_Chr03g0097391 [Helianthus annuus]|uniref:Uncharacterized protein n=1 Tax=Helianthus annuus TaxID=4232 RepID=A0A9K3JE21_HELAN|nr:hypothetical protein HanXRQr2_Chr03g0097391 [Helianthus annuus]KAJ0942592.1 hypothetical protein HanPSC8_Chr03g0093831 [Helianthus annuus]
MAHKLTPWFIVSSSHTLYSLLSLFRCLIFFPETFSGQSVPISVYDK